MAYPFASALLWTVALASISAQTQVNAPPNAEETLRYVNAAKPSMYTSSRGAGGDLTPLMVSSDRTQFLLHHDDGGSTLDGQVDIRELDPTAVSVVHYDAFNDIVRVGCSQKKICYTEIGRIPGMTPSFDRSDNFNVWITPDGDKADRVARALRHLVELLQAEYKSSHTSPVDPNDPFAKPQ